MGSKMLQCKDIPDAPILAVIARQQHKSGGVWLCAWYLEPYYSDFPDKLFRAKMGSLIKRGLVQGCACGCRGDYELTKKGVVSLANTYDNEYDFESVGLTRPYEAHGLTQVSKTDFSDKEMAQKVGALLSGGAR